ncbi:hypothetical protein ONZ45_g5558 [Pleurotus djamor]|nr:hypothetical protein ONZ45_g5558 [Pleurotus djamor]
MVFSLLNLTDDDDQRDNSTNASYGEIRVEIWEVTASGQTTTPKIPLMASPTVHEAAKKAGVHCVGLGGQLKKAPTSCYLVKYTKLLTTFTFYYKPLDVLQAHEIAPRPPPKSPSPATSPSRCSPPLEADESHEEFQRLQTQMQEIQARMNAISKGKRPAIKTEDGPSAKRIKREPIVVPNLLPGEVIDLTLDD